MVSETVASGLSSVREAQPYLRYGEHRRTEMCPRSRFMRPFLVELLQEAQIAFVEQAQVVDPVAQHGQAFQARAEREADELFRIQAEITYDGRMHLAGARDFQPAALERTGAEGDVDLGRGLGGGEVGRPETHLP